MPPRDDSERSSVRLVTRWVYHSLGKTGCLERAAMLLKQAKYFVEPGEISVFGTREGMTFSVRCDAEDIAILSTAYRHRQSAETENQRFNEIALPLPTLVLRVSPL